MMSTQTVVSFPVSHPFPKSRFTTMTMSLALLVLIFCQSMAQPLWQNTVIYSDAACNNQVAIRVDSSTCSSSALGPCTATGLGGFTRTSCTAIPFTNSGPTGGPALSKQSFLEQYSVLTKTTTAVYSDNKCTTLAWFIASVNGAGCFSTGTKSFQLQCATASGTLTAQEWDLSGSCTGAQFPTLTSPSTGIVDLFSHILLTQYSKIKHAKVAQ